mmetsp:Transcript_21826/g.53915  ORF Transcript_21826/g.53915 Transcript_21826/m.53915 type:complete len:652 (-) Transcript_21826:699-2654(-)
MSPNHDVGKKAEQVLRGQQKFEGGNSAVIHQGESILSDGSPFLAGAHNEWTGRTCKTKDVIKQEHLHRRSKASNDPARHIQEILDIDDLAGTDCNEIISPFVTERDIFGGSKTTHSISGEDDVESHLENAASSDDFSSDNTLLKGSIEILQCLPNPFTYIPHNSAVIIDPRVDIAALQRSAKRTPPNARNERSFWRRGLEVSLRLVEMRGARLLCYIMASDSKEIFDFVDSASEEAKQAMARLQIDIGNDQHYLVVGLLVAEKLKAMWINDVVFDSVKSKNYGRYFLSISTFASAVSATGIEVHTNLREFMRKQRVGLKFRSQVLPAFLNMLQNGVHVWGMSSGDFEWLSEQQKRGGSIFPKLVSVESSYKEPSRTQKVDENLIPFMIFAIRNRNEVFGFVGVAPKKILVRNSSSIIAQARSFEPGLEPILEHMRDRDHPAACAAAAILATRCKMLGVSLVKLRSIKLAKKGGHTVRFVAFCRTLMENGVQVYVDLPSFWKKHRIKKKNRWSHLEPFLILRRLGARIQGIVKADAIKVAKTRRLHVEQTRHSSRLRRRQAALLQHAAKEAFEAGLPMGPVLDYDECIDNDHRLAVTQRALGESDFERLVPKIDPILDARADDDAEIQEHLDLTWKSLPKRIRPKKKRLRDY